METEKIACEQRKRKVLVVLGIAQIIAALASLLLGRFESAVGLLSILAAVGWAVGILLWVKIDSEERGTEVSSGFRIGLIVLGFFALSYYLFRSRGFVGGLKGIGWALLYFVTVALVYLVVSVIILSGLGLARII